MSIGGTVGAGTLRTSTATVFTGVAVRCGTNAAMRITSRGSLGPGFARAVAITARAITAACAEMLAMPPFTERSLWPLDSSSVANIFDSVSATVQPLEVLPAVQ